VDYFVAKHKERFLFLVVADGKLAAEKSVCTALQSLAK
jgi:hypothetical protein